MRRLHKLLTVFAGAALLAALPQVGQAVRPSFFPEGLEVDATSYTLRLSGDDRAATAGTLAMVAAVNKSTPSGYPFSEPDSTSAAKAWGLGTCPKTVGVAAGDAVADALAASSVKDLGALVMSGVTLDTGGAVLLLTDSGRSGATALNAKAKATLTQIKNSGCVFDALLFGGPEAVPNEAAGEIGEIADDVARVSGEDRFDTAAKIATAVSTAAGLPTITFFGGTSAAEKTTLPGTLFLSEANTGADALAVGPFSAGTNAPILLTNSTSLPGPTQAALASLKPTNIIVLGGEGAIDKPTADAAAAAAGGATVRRVSGDDRYATSVEAARRLFGIFAPSRSAIDGSTGAALSNQAFGFARSEGSGTSHLGFADALASAFFLDSFAENRVTPKRLVPPVEQQDGTKFIGGVAGPNRTPLLLVTQGSQPGPINTYLTSLYPRADDFKTALAPARANDGGFAFFFGGIGAITAPVEESIAERMSGGNYVAGPPSIARSDLKPTIDSTKAFYTAMGFGADYVNANGPGVDADGAVSDGDKFCVTRGSDFNGGIDGAQWLRVDSAAGYVASLQVDYENAGTQFPAAESLFQCVDASGVATDVGTLTAVSASGRLSTSKPFDWAAAANRLSTTVPGTAGSAALAGGNPWADISSFPTSGGTATGTYNWTGSADITFKGTAYPSAILNITMDLKRTDGPAGPSTAETDDRIGFTGILRVFDATTKIFEVNLAGESTKNTSPLKLVGAYSLGTRLGGFRATITKDAASNNAAVSDLVIDGSA